MSPAQTSTQYMRHALALAARGEGFVEPNPMVGCVVVQGDRVVGEGWHARFGGPHAEVAALTAAGESARGATMYVTLEPCCHHGKTPPCSQAVINAGISRVVVAMLDPFAQVSGGGVQQLRDAGIAVEVGTLQDEARQLTAPYRKLIATNRPWVIAKWAMTLDGKLATTARHSQWISGEESRAIVHQLRGRVDAILVGRGTSAADNPSLTVRPPGPRVPTRILLDSQASLPLDSKLVATAKDAPVLLAASPTANAKKRQSLQNAGVEVLLCEGEDQAARLMTLLEELGRRRMTNLLVEGGSQVFGSLFDLNEIDEVHAFIAPKLAGGDNAPSPIAGVGIQQMSAALPLADATVETIGPDVYIHGRIPKDDS